MQSVKIHCREESYFVDTIGSIFDLLSKILVREQIIANDGELYDMLKEVDLQEELKIRVNEQEVEYAV